jgi:hypothetical protein
MAMLSTFAIVRATFLSWVIVASADPLHVHRGWQAGEDQKPLNTPLKEDPDLLSPPVVMILHITKTHYQFKMTTMWQAILHLCRKQYAAGMQSRNTELAIVWLAPVVKLGTNVWGSRRTDKYLLWKFMILFLMFTNSFQCETAPHCQCELYDSHVATCP